MCAIKRRAMGPQQCTWMLTSADTWPNRTDRVQGFSSDFCELMGVWQIMNSYHASGTSKMPEASAGSPSAKEIWGGGVNPEGCVAEIGNKLKFIEWCVRSFWKRCWTILKSEMEKSMETGKKKKRSKPRVVVLKPPSTKNKIPNSCRF